MLVESSDTAPRDGFGRQLLRQRPDEVAVAEGLEVEVIRCGGGPEAERVDVLAAVAHDRPIVRIPIQLVGWPGTGRKMPSRNSIAQFSLTSTLSSGRATSHVVRAPQPVVRLLLLANRRGWPV
jgi:hypothetical protein